MSERVSINGQASEVFEGEYGGGVPGHALIGVQNGYAWGVGFFNSDQLMSIARLCTELAQEIEHEEQA